jgi:hypothetical protein
MSVTSEEFRDIEGYEGLYQVSNLGTIRSVDRYVNHYSNHKSLRKAKPKAININKKTGYAMVVLYKNSKGKTCLVHRLVAKAFPEICGSWFEKCEIDHLDTNRTNNIVTNLRVCTRHENHMNPLTRERYRKNGTFVKGQKSWNKGMKFPEKSGANHFNAKEITQLTKDGKIINKYETIASASKITNIIRSAIDNCLSGRSKTAGNYVWKYAKECD